jgi:2-dehydro-3-deoxygalactonokinase
MDNQTKKAAWIAVDWGTTNLRVWMMGRDNVPFEQAHSDKGMGGLARDEFEPALTELIAPYLADDQVTPVICAGMVGAREGWREANYIATPCPPPGRTAAVKVEAQDPRISVTILPGIKQITPPDVMRGEETQIAGILREYPNFDGIICLPGTHTKWVHISAGEIVSFQTFMTGEMFALLSEQSVLRHSVTSDDWDQQSYLTAISDAMTRPQSVTAHLFGLRAGGLVGELAAETARARLSGLLIGIELAAARPYWLGQNVAIIGAGVVAELYRSALVEQGVPAAVRDVADLTLTGLTAAYTAQEGASE